MILDPYYSTCCPRFLAVVKDFCYWVKTTLAVKQAILTCTGNNANNLMDHYLTYGTADPKVSIWIFPITKKTDGSLSFVGGDTPSTWSVDNTNNITKKAEIRIAKVFVDNLERMDCNQPMWLNHSLGYIYQSLLHEFIHYLHFMNEAGSLYKRESLLDIAKKGTVPPLLIAKEEEDTYACSTAASGLDMLKSPTLQQMVAGTISRKPRSVLSSTPTALVPTPASPVISSWT